MKWLRNTIRIVLEDLQTALPFEEIVEEGPMFKPPTPKEFEELVKKHLKEEKAGTSLYSKYVREAGELNLCEIEEKDVKRGEEVPFY